MRAAWPRRRRRSTRTRRSVDRVDPPGHGVEPEPAAARNQPGQPGGIVGGDGRQRAVRAAAQRTPIPARPAMPSTTRRPTGAPCRSGSSPSRGLRACLPIAQPWARGAPAATGRAPAHSPAHPQGPRPPPHERTSRTDLLFRGWRPPLPGNLANAPVVSEASRGHPNNEVVCGVGRPSVPASPKRRIRTRGPGQVCSRAGLGPRVAPHRPDRPRSTDPSTIARPRRSPPIHPGSPASKAIAPSPLAIGLLRLGSIIDDYGGGKAREGAGRREKARGAPAATGRAPAAVSRGPAGRRRPGCRTSRRAR